MRSLLRKLLACDPVSHATRIRVATGRYGAVCTHDGRARWAVAALGLQ